MRCPMYSDLYSKSGHGPRSQFKASFDPEASQMQISVAIELYGSYDPGWKHPKPLWGSPGGRTVGSRSGVATDPKIAY